MSNSIIESFTVIFRLTGTRVDVLPETLQRALGISSPNSDLNLRFSLLCFGTDPKSDASCILNFTHKSLDLPYNHFFIPNQNLYPLIKATKDVQCMMF